MARLSWPASCEDGCLPQYGLGPTSSSPVMMAACDHVVCHMMWSRGVICVQNSRLKCDVIKPDGDDRSSDHELLDADALDRLSLPSVCCLLRSSVFNSQLLSLPAFQLGF